MHSPIKNQQAISVTTTVFTATSFMLAWGQGSFIVVCPYAIQEGPNVQQYLSPLEGESILGEVAHTLQHTTHVGRGDQLHLRNDSLI